MKTLLASVAVLFITTSAHAGPCEDDALSDCAAYYAARGLIGSGAMVKGCIDWVISACYSDYDTVKADLAQCQDVLAQSASDTAYWRNNYQSCKSELLALTDGCGADSADLNSCNAALSTCNEQLTEVKGANDNCTASLQRRIKKLKRVCGTKCKKL